MLSCGGNAMSEVLIYNLPPEKDAKVKLLCRKFGFDSLSAVCIFIGHAIITSFLQSFRNIISNYSDDNNLHFIKEL